MPGSEPGRCPISPLPAPMRPATEWIFVVSSALSSVIGGMIDGSRRASIVLPEPGEPIISTLWPPAAAISSARLATRCPLTSLKSAS